MPLILVLYRGTFLFLLNSLAKPCSVSKTNKLNMGQVCTWWAAAAGRWAWGGWRCAATCWCARTGARRPRSAAWCSPASSTPAPWPTTRCPSPSSSWITPRTVNTHHSINVDKNLHSRFVTSFCHAVWDEGRKRWWILSPTSARQVTQSLNNSGWRPRECFFCLCVYCCRVHKHCVTSVTAVQWTEKTLPVRPVYVQVRIRILTVPIMTTLPQWQSGERFPYL